MKKLLLAGVIASICSGAAVAADETKTQEEGVRFNTAVGPFYDPIFDFAGSVIPTLTYEVGDATKTSNTKLYGIYGTNGNYVLMADSTNYMGANNEWLVYGKGTYTYSKLDVSNFMRFAESMGQIPDSAGLFEGSNGFRGITSAPTVEVEQVTINFQANVAYQIMPDLYIGPSIDYTTTEFERDSSAPAWGSINMVTDKETLGYGIKATYDKRNNELTPTEGMFFSVDAKTFEMENTDGAVVTVSDLGKAADPALAALDGMTLNGTDEYEEVKVDARYYMPMGAATTLALRAKANWHSDGAQDTLAALDTVAHGFTMEISGRSAYGTDVQLRHWLTPDVGIVGGVAFAKAQDVVEGGDDDIHYAFNVGARYMLAPEDGLSMRLDVAYNDQEEDNLVVFFNVGETF